MTLCGFGLAWLLVWTRRRAIRLIPAFTWFLAPLVAGLAVWPTIGVEPTNGEVTVAVVQGNAPDIGLELLSARDQIRANHLATSERLISDIEAGRVAKPELVIWPETATGLDSEDPELNRLVDRFGVPTLIGALYTRADGVSENSVFQWDPGDGAGEHYAKQELVPFAEYVPWRPIAAWFTPFLDNTKDMRWGDEPGVLSPGGIPVGLQICYEVAYDYVARQTVDLGAQLLVVPTNNAWYGPGEMTYRQLAMSRLRAVEHGRAAAVAATSGVSAIVMPDGSVVRSSELFTSDVLVGKLPLRDTTTVASLVGPWPERVLVAGGVGALVISVGWRIRECQRHHVAGTHRERERLTAQFAQPRQAAGGKRRQRYPVGGVGLLNGADDWLSRGVGLDVDVEVGIRQLFEHLFETADGFDTGDLGTANVRPGQRGDGSRAVRGAVQRGVVVHHDNAVRCGADIGLDIGVALSGRAPERCHRVLQAGELADMPSAMRESARIRERQVRVHDY